MYVGGVGWGVCARQRVRGYDSSVSGVLASEARFILFRSMLADSFVAWSLNQYETECAHVHTHAHTKWRNLRCSVDDSCPHSEWILQRTLN